MRLAMLCRSLPLKVGLKKLDSAEWNRYKRQITNPFVVNLVRPARFINAEDGEHHQDIS